MNPFFRRFRPLLAHALFALAALAVSFSASATETFCTYALSPCDPNNPTSKCYVPQEPDCKCWPKDCKKCTASPTFAGSGVYEISATDLSIPTNGFPLLATRRYSSAHGIDGPTGFGWTSSFHARLHETAYLFLAPSTYRIVAEVVLPDGEHMTFTDNGVGFFAPPEGRYDFLQRNADGSYALTLQRSRSVLRYSAAGLLESITDDYGNAQTFTYDTGGRLEQVSDASGSGRYLNVYWGANGRISSIEDHTGRVVHYGYNTQGMLTSVTNAAGQITTYSYVSGRFSPLLSQVRDHWNRLVSETTWDLQGRVASYTENGETFTYIYGYDEMPTQTAKKDAAANTWVFTFGDAGLITKRQQPPPPLEGQQGTASYTQYYSDGSVKLQTDEVGVKTLYTYLSLGRVGSVTRDYEGTYAVMYVYTYDAEFPEKVTTIIPYDPETLAVDPNWQGSKYDYYPVGSAAPGALHHVYRLHGDAVTADLMTTYTYDTKGRMASATDGAGATTDYTYDAAGNRLTVTAPANNDAGVRPVTTYGYDALGRVTSMTDPLGKVTAYTYDALDRIVTVTPPKPSSGSPLDFTMTYSYDHHDPFSTYTATHVTDPNGVVTKQAYDVYGRLRRATDGLGNVTAYGYTRDLLTAITDANANITTYSYDALKRLQQTTFPDGKAEWYAYTTDGQLRAKTDREAQTIAYEYDALKRLAKKSYAPSQSIVYSYTGQKLMSVTDTSVTPGEMHTFTYDTAFRVTSNTQGGGTMIPAEPVRGTIDYTYTATDAVATMAVDGGPTTTYGYYADGSLRTIDWSPTSATGVFKYDYRRNGQYETIAFPNGQTRNYAYDDHGRLLQLANLHPTAGNLATYTYAYDLNHTTAAYDRLGQRVSMTADVPSQDFAGALTKYHYDAAYQLTRADYPSAAPFNGETHSWTYDAIGNRLTNTVNGTTTTYTYQKIGTNPNNSQRLLSDGTATYTYDNNGSVLSDGANTYGWNRQNRMVSANTVAAVYRYDYSGRRSRKNVDGIETAYVYNDKDLVAERGGTTSAYVFGPAVDEPLAFSRNGKVLYYVVDGVGSTVMGTDGPAVARNSYAYDAWGISRFVNEAEPQPFRYTAREKGDVLGQYFYRARFYAPGAGRFLSEDPLNPSTAVRVAASRPDSPPEWAELGAGMNLYAYVSNSPLLFKDPSGLAYCLVTPLGKVGDYMPSGPDGKTYKGCVYVGICGPVLSGGYIKMKGVMAYKKPVSVGCPCPSFCLIPYDMNTGQQNGKATCFDFPVFPPVLYFP